MDEQPVKKAHRKKACDSLIGRISHDIQIASVAQPMTEVCTTASWANHRTLSRLQTSHIRLSLPARKPQSGGTTPLLVQLLEKVSLLLSGYMENIKNSFIISVSPPSLQHKQVSHPNQCIYLCQGSAYIDRHSTHF